jgi:hypothetical protein
METLMRLAVVLLSITVVLLATYSLYVHDCILDMAAEVAVLTGTPDAGAVAMIQRIQEQEDLRTVASSP